ncbi:hypothetical protein SAMN05216348_104126 [Olsenella sp. KH3B4]|uniref:hypothetical protein n=1 Tax=Olsenella sp. KH3B4 TaxID=1855394 RepID=UPI0008CF9250|nr:hypothetical protein [Olsenella sp. KH3B4]SES92290.1 hypothetical protein SAMN05216348_104126 [Olsenella sp. KH3B4]
MTCRRSPAVVAGLLGVVSLGMPSPAMAEEGTAPLDALSNINLSSIDPETAGAVCVSFAGGVLVTLGTYALVSSFARRRGSASQADEPAEAGETNAGQDARGSLAPRHMRSEKVPHASCRKAEGSHADETHYRTDGSPASGAHAARDYEDIAENYVEKQSFRKRMATRAQGVAATLSARIDANRMEGLPVIERADGSVGDVGTPWWTAAVGPAVSGPVGIGEGAADAIPSEFGAAGIDDLQFMSVGPREISRRVAPVEQDAYPEKRSVEDVTEDDWDRALKAMDEKIGTTASPTTESAAQAKPSAPTCLEPFSDCVGDEDSLDEPDDIAQPTQFLNFKPPAGHPEVVDTETYVDYLLADEFSRNPSAAVRRSSRDYLRVIEGGTQTSALRVRGRHMASGKHGATPDGGYRPRHFAGSNPLAQVEALEA